MFSITYFEILISSFLNSTSIFPKTCTCSSLLGFGSFPDPSNCCVYPHIDILSLRSSDPSVPDLTPVSSMECQNAWDRPSHVAIVDGVSIPIAVSDSFLHCDIIHCPDQTSVRILRGSQPLLLSPSLPSEPDSDPGSLQAAKDTKTYTQTIHRD